MINKETITRILKWVDEEEAKAIKAENNAADRLQEQLSKGEAKAFAKVKRRLKLLLL